MNSRAGMRGFSLVELIAIIVLLAVGIVSLLQVFGTATRSIANNVDGQLGAQLAQERAEQLLADRRNQNPGFGYNSLSLAIVTTNQTPIPAFPNYWRRTQVSALASGAGSPCPAGASCKRVQITVVRTGQPITQPVGQITFMVVDY